MNVERREGEQDTLMCHEEPLKQIKEGINKIQRCPNKRNEYRTKRERTGYIHVPRRGKKIE